MENQSDKSQEATPFKLEDARKKGQVGRSMEFVSIASLTVMMGTFLFLIPAFSMGLLKSLEKWMYMVPQLSKSDGLLMHILGDFIGNIAWPVVVILLIGALSAVFFNLLHVGPVFSFFPMKMDFSKLNPVQGLKKIFSMKGLFDTVKVLVKLIFIAFAGIFVWGQISSLILHDRINSMTATVENWQWAFVILVTTFLAVFIIFALVDLWFSKRDFARKMRMSTRDIKDEHKRREGDPDIKNKRRKNMLQLIKSVLGASNIKGADVIVTNPTHYAVALQYRAHKMPLPKILASGKGFVAKIIMQRARKLGIPIMRKPPLARQLYSDGHPGSFIPVTAQVEVAEIYREVIKMPRSKVFA